MDRYRLGSKLGTTIYRNDEKQPCGWVPGNHKLAARIVTMLNEYESLDQAREPRARKGKTK